MALDTAVVVRQIESLLEEVQRAEGRAQYDDLSDLPDQELRSLRIRCEAAVERLAPQRSSYAASALELAGKNDGWSIIRLAGTLEALKVDYEAGHLRTLEELVHADLFSDFIEMADHLLVRGFKDPAAVVAGSVLEVHARKLAAKADVDVSDAKGRPKSFDLLTADLVKVGSLTEADRKLAAAWFGIRKHAAHGEGDEIVTEQVRIVIEGIRAFLPRYPA